MDAVVAFVVGSEIPDMVVTVRELSIFKMCLPFEAQRIHCSHIFNNLSRKTCVAKAPSSAAFFDTSER